MPAVQRRATPSRAGERPVEWEAAIIRQDSAAKDFIDFCGQLEIEVADAVHAVRRKVENDFVPHVEPFGMVIHGFGDESDARHVAEGRDEVLTLKRAMELAVFKSPAFVLDKPLLKFRVREFVRGHDSNLLQWTSRAVRDAPPHYHGSSSA